MKSIFEFQKTLNNTKLLFSIQEWNNNRGILHVKGTDKYIPFEWSGDIFNLEKELQVHSQKGIVKKFKSFKISKRISLFLQKLQHA